MVTITFGKSQKTAKRSVRVEFTKEPQNVHRLIEKSNGELVYRVGTDKGEKMAPRTFITFIRTLVQSAKAHQIDKLVIDINDLLFPTVLKKSGREWILQTVAENCILADYSFTKYKTKKKEQKTLNEIIFLGTNESDKVSIQKGIMVAEYANIARDISNTTAEDMTPTKFGETAKKLARGTKVKVTVLTEKEIQKQKMNLLYAVGRGTRNETRFIILEHFGAKNKKEKPLVLVGKGVTYDTGGLNVKPSGGMHEMHMDMSGGAAVIASIFCAEKLKIKKNIVALVPTAENAVSDSAMRAGDIVTSLSGKTVEILHTDAEGRLILADALTYSQRYNPKVVLDVATLTGAALVALGQHASAILTKDEKLEQTLRTLGEESGDYVWPLPLWDEYQQHLKSSRADIANIATNFSRFGGTIEGGAFLSNFAPECPWAHIDIAPRMNSIASDRLAKGSTGEPVRLLVKFLETY